MRPEPLSYLKKIAFAVLVLCFSSNGLHAQNLDSLEKALGNKNLSAEDRIRLYDDLSWEYLYISFDKSSRFARAGLQLAQDENDERMIATLYRNLGIAYYMANVFDTSEMYLNEALDRARKAEHTQLETRIYGALGNLYNIQSRYSAALDQYLRALAQVEKEGHRSNEASLRASIGSVYQKLRNTKQARRYFEESKHIAEEIGDNGTLASALTSLSDLVMADDKKKSIAYAEEAVRIFHDSGNRHSEAIALQTLAKAYYTYDEFGTAMQHAQKALQISQDAGFPNLIAQALVIISNIHYYNKAYPESEAAALAALQKDSTDVNIALNLLSNIARSNMYMGRIDKATDYLDRHQDMVIRYANTEYQRALSEAEARYETDKKELKIESLEGQKRLYGWLGISVASFLLFALSYFVVRHRLAVSRRRIAEQQITQIEQEKQLIAVQAALEGEAAERSRLAKDLHDGLGSMLSVVKFNLPPLRSGAVMEGEDVNRFQKALEMLDDSIRELRRVAHHMMPETLVRYGLKASLSDFCDAISIVEFHYFGSENRLPQNLEMLIYRSVHELVNNALKHAEATQISVQLVQDTDRISITVQDDGKGFDQTLSHQGTGLANIRQRVESQQGKMNIYSSEQGTEIHIELEYNTTS